MHLHWLLAGTRNEDLTPAIEIDNTHAIGAIVSDVSSVPRRVNRDEAWLVMNRDRRNHAVGISVNDGHRTGLCVGDVDLMTYWVCRHMGRVATYLKRSI